jgi:prophage regulatory protein
LRVSQGLWTKPVSLGARAVGWPSDEVEAINAARIAGNTDGEIRILVAKMEAARKWAK